jgi:hypothetical protein
MNQQMRQQPSAAASNSQDSAMLSDFNQLQRKLVTLWKQIGRSDPGGPVELENSIVVVPSISLDVDVSGSAIQAFEQRFLFLLFLLQQPNKRIIYVTSQPVQQKITDYYLDLLPGVIISSARKRLIMICVEDSSANPLTQKLLDRPHVINHIRSLIPDLNRAHMVPFNTTDLERRLAVQLGIPMYAADPTYIAFGSKSGSRRIFAEEGIPFPLGREDLFSEMALVEAIREMRSQKPALEKLIAKLNQGVGGMGNATIHLETLPPAGHPHETAALEEALRNMQFELPHVTYESYLTQVKQGGAIVEELISGLHFRSPSAQLRISPLGEVEMLSTHDQILGGPTGQSFLGARFPADSEYAWPIMEQSLKVGQRLAKEGIIGRFAVDFASAQSDEGGWQHYAIEINLRKGGTTAPFLSLQYLTNGRYDPQQGIFRTTRGDPKFYVASDHVESPDYRLFTPDILFDIVSRHRLHFDHTCQTGIILHMINNIGGAGQFGATAVADSHEEAEDLYQGFLSIIKQEAMILHQT